MEQDICSEKTLIKHLLSKWGILSTELITAIDADMAVINEDGTKEYVDNEPDVVNVASEEAAPEPIEAPKEEKEENTDVASALFG